MIFHKYKIAKLLSTILAMRVATVAHRCNVDIPTELVLGGRVGRNGKKYQLHAYIRAEDITRVSLVSACANTKPLRKDGHENNSLK